MSNSSTVFLDEVATEDYSPYRALSKAAVTSALLGVMSVAAMWLEFLVVLPLLGFLLGWWALVQIRRYPNELSGQVFALSGTLMCGALLVTSVGFHSYEYAHEVPEGYERIDFSVLQPQLDHPELPVSPAALELSGKKVFIKGYVFPGSQRTNIKQFVLVPDMGTCCFGGQPKLTHMMEVTLTDHEGIEYSFKKRKLAGELTVDTRLKPVSGVGGVYFQLKAYVVN